MVKKIQIFTNKMKEREENYHRLFGELKQVDRSTLKVQENKDAVASEVTNPSLTDIVQNLSMGTCTLFFYKITDGSLRKMKCTLQGVSPTKTKYNRDGVLAVWDLDANQWRSFYANRVFKLVRNEKTDAE